VSHHTQQASENEDEKHVQNAFYLDVAAKASALNLGLITKSFSTPTGFIDIYRPLAAFQVFDSFE
jgi:hypothetical protein